MLTVLITDQYKKWEWYVANHLEDGLVVGRDYAANGDDDYRYVSTSRLRTGISGLRPDRVIVFDTVLTQSEIDTIRVIGEPEFASQVPGE